MSTRWTFERALYRQSETAEAILELMVGPRQLAPVPFDAFAHVEGADFLLRLLSGALRQSAEGINILIQGTPGDLALVVKQVRYEKGPDTRRSSRPADTGGKT